MADSSCTIAYHGTWHSTVYVLFLEFEFSLSACYVILGGRLIPVGEYARPRLLGLLHKRRTQIWNHFVQRRPGTEMGTELRALIIILK